jgi:capsular exopolysaccharide synthesis family protein
MFGDRNNVLIEPPAPAAPVGGPGGPGGDGEIHLLDRLSVIYRYRKVAFTVVVVVFTAGFVQAMATTPEFRATASVQVQDEQNAAGLQSAETEFRTVDTLMATESQFVMSRELLRIAAAPLNLKNNPEFNGQEPGPSGLGEVMLSLARKATAPVRRLIGADPTPLPITTDDASPEAAATAEDVLVDLFSSRVEVGTDNETRTMHISVVSTNPVFAAEAANRVAQTYVDENLKRKQGSNREKQQQVADQLAEVEKSIQDFDEQMVRARSEPNSLALANPESLAQQEFEYGARLSQAEQTAANSKKRYDELRVIAHDNPTIDAFPAMGNDSAVSSLKQQLNSHKAELERRIRATGEKHPSVVAQRDIVENTAAQLATARNLVVDRLRQQWENDDAVATGYRNALASLRSSRDAVASKTFAYGNLVVRRQAAEELRGSLLVTKVEIDTILSGIQNNVRLLNGAVPPARPFRPDTSRTLLMSLFLGFAIAGALAFGLDYLDDTIKTPEDITRKLRLPFLGLVPSVRSDKQPVLSGPVPHDFGEAYRALRTSLVFTSGGESTRIITCTSAQPLEGKTTTACNLAMVLAFGGSRVLLIDADMRRPGVHKALKINNTVGLSHLLVGQARVREAIQRTSDPNFCVMTAGRTPPNPSELLSSERMKQLIANLKQGPFDWVVIDTPPVLAVTDAVILTPLVDGVTFVLGAEMTRRRLAERAVQMLMVSRPRVVGAVLNRVNFDRNKYYYSRYYGYQYKSYYGSGAGSTAKA